MQRERRHPLLLCQASVDGCHPKARFSPLYPLSVLFAGNVMLMQIVG